MTMERKPLSCTGAYPGQELRRHELRGPAHSALLPHERRQSEVDELERAVRVKDNVLRLEVEVRNAVAVNVGQRARKLARMPSRAALRVYLL